MKKVAKSSVFSNRLHKGFVMACVGLTLYGVGHMGMRWYRYFTVLRPETKRREEVDKKIMLSEGSSSDLLHDKAATLVS